MSYGTNEETGEVKFGVVADILDIIEVEEGVTNTSQRHQRTRVLPTRLQDCEVVGDDEVTPNRDLVHFDLLAGAEHINYNEAFKDKQWKEAMVEDLEAIERNNT